MTTKRFRGVFGNEAMRSNALPNSTVLTDDEVHRLLVSTSRTFALAIPLLEPPLARQVGLAYLLFRIADELEDAPLWNRDERAKALDAFLGWLDGHAAALAARDHPPTTNAGCLELLTRADDVLAATHALPPQASAAILAHVKRTAAGMRGFVARQDDHGALTLATVEDLRSYCYFVAGIVGELLTELFVLADVNASRAKDALATDARPFGEGLQLVNILKDAASDAREGRMYLPRDVDRADVVTLARADLTCAERYVTTLRGANAAQGIVAFCDLPVRLAVATLHALDRGAPKLTREEVAAILSSLIA